MNQITSPEPGPDTEVQLKRSLSLPLVLFYGLGTMLGAGIYALVGEVAGRAGMLAPVAFLLSASIAAFTGLSYAELCTRLPKSAGEAVYVQAGFRRAWLSVVVGLLSVGLLIPYNEVVVATWPGGAKNLSSHEFSGV